MLTQELDMHVAAQLKLPNEGSFGIRIQSRNSLSRDPNFIIDLIPSTSRIFWANIIVTHIPGRDGWLAFFIIYSFKKIVPIFWFPRRRYPSIRHVI